MGRIQVLQVLIPAFASHFGFSDFKISSLLAVPDAPILKHLCTVLIFKPPPNPAGKIITYEICLGHNCSGEMSCYNISYLDDNFFLTTKEQQEDNVYAKVNTVQQDLGVC